MPDIANELNEINVSLSGISLDVTSATLLTTQGLNSIALGIDASFGPAVLHINKRPLKEGRLQKVPKKMKAIAEFLSLDSAIPTARIYAIGHLKDGGYYILQNRMVGETVGSQTIKDDEVVPVYAHPDSEKVMVEAERMFAALHSKSLTTRFGHVTVDAEGGLTAPYATWREFIHAGSQRWLLELEQAKLRDAGYDALLLAARAHVSRLEEKYDDVFAWDTPCFVHGDLNPGNILTNGGKVTAILDFEWAVSGDPAWEFAFAATFPTAAYYSVSAETPASLERRKGVYRFFWLLWGANVHVHNDDLFLCTWLLKKCLESADTL